MTMEPEDPMRELEPLHVIQERDIDLLLLEELHSSPDFVAWFGERVSTSAFCVQYFRN